MKLHQLPKTHARSKKRLGRGLGSGKGKTGGRGTKGQKARGKIPALFAGGGLALYRKLPFRRGWGNKKASVKALPVDISKLVVFKNKAEVSLESLIEQGVVKKEALKRGVKIVGNGTLKSSLVVKVSTSKSAAQVIEKAGGKVVNV